MKKYLHCNSKYYVSAPLCFMPLRSFTSFTFCVSKTSNGPSCWFTLLLLCCLPLERGDLYLLCYMHINHSRSQSLGRSAYDSKVWTVCLPPWPLQHMFTPKLLKTLTLHLEYKSINKMLCYLVYLCVPCCFLLYSP